MSFIDNLKRSLGYEDLKAKDSDSDFSGFGEIFDNFKDTIRGGVNNQNNNRQPSNPRPVSNPTHTQVPNPRPSQAPVYDDYDDFVIIPEQSFYEITLIRPKTIDDINYVVDQVVEEKNPVILDLSFLERESPANFRLAGEKIKQMRSRFGAQALLLARSEEKNLIIISPKKVKLVNKS